ncbi:MAG: hypothetical protein ACYDEN_03920 [Acidimicrobiales bacterium]
MKGWMRAGRARYATVAAAAAVVAALWTSSGPTTTVETYEPWTTHGTLAKGIEVGGTVRGTCWAPSIAVSTADAYRCISGNAIYDPCFARTASARTGQLACAVDPWTKVELFDLGKPIGKGAVHSNGRPVVWADRLANGVSCTLDTGTGAYVDHVVMNYYCTPYQGWATFPTRAHEPWTVRFAGSSHARRVSRVAVTSAWY